MLIFSIPQESWHISETLLKATRKLKMRDILFVKQAVKGNFIAAAHRN